MAESSERPPAMPAEPLFLPPVAPAPEHRQRPASTPSEAVGSEAEAPQKSARPRRSSSPETAEPVPHADADESPRGTPPPARETPLTVIDTLEGLQNAVAELAAGTGPFGVDAERASGFRYSQRAYLIQVFREGAGVYLFDPPAIGDFSALAEVMAGEEWILHAASQDLACLREIGLDPETIFDTELGARLAGLPRVGLGTVVEELLGIHLKKEHSAADWSTRPLPSAWLEYAALDVELLPDLRAAIAGLLETAGKSDFAAQEFQAVLDRETPVRVDPWRRLSGLHQLRSPKQLAVARALWTARDTYAQEVDTSPGRLVPDAALTAVAKAMPESKRALASIKEFTGRASRSQIDRWWDAVEAGRAETDLPVVRPPSDSLPPPRSWGDRNPDAGARLKSARAALTTIAEGLDMPVENLLTPEILRRVSWSPPTSIDTASVAAALSDLGARTWQIDATAQAITESFVEALQSDGDDAETTS